MTIGATGNVSIGTTVDSFIKLRVDYSGSSTITATNSGGGTALYASSASGVAINGISDTGFAGFFTGKVRVVGSALQLQALGNAGSQALCRNANDEVSACSSSLRYKKDIQPFRDGWHFIERLRPITYKWKADDQPDIGFGAEDVEKINPLFVTYNPKGEIEGVKYDRLSLVFVNAFKEQQAHLDAQNQRLTRQQAQLQRQQREIDQLKQAVKTLTAAARRRHRRPSRARINNHY